MSVGAQVESLCGDLPFPPLQRWRGGPAGSALGPCAQGTDLLGHELRERHEVCEDFSDGEIGGFVAAVESAVERFDEDLFDYPWLYVVEPGYWALADEEADRLREYLLRGGFMMFDDFHGSLQWAMFMRGMTKIFPDRPVVDISEKDEILHVLYDLDERTQIPGIRMLYTGKTYEEDGYDPHWRGIYDDDGRLMVLINFNMDLGDAWEHADWPEYPERYTALAYRLGINYIVYSMTH